MRLRLIYSENEGEDDAKAKIKEMKIQEVKKLVGVRKIVDAISERQLPVIGFEVLNDLMFLMNWCVDRLPSTCSEFVEMVSKIFPLVIDVQVHLKLK